MAYLTIIAVAVISYLIGSVNFSIMLSKAIGGKDIRESGSGNAGATNMLRTYGKKMGILTLLLDVFKGVAAILIMRYIVYTLIPDNVFFDMGSIETALYLSLSYIAGVCVILGHNFPLYFGFKGGKGVATSLGVVLMLDWKVGLAVAVCAIAVMAVTRYVSLGSILGGALYIVIEITKTVMLRKYNIAELACIVIIGGLLIIRHKENIKRLLNGTENKLSFKKSE